VCHLIFRVNICSGKYCISTYAHVNIVYKCTCKEQILSHCWISHFHTPHHYLSYLTSLTNLLTSGSFSILAAASPKCNAFGWKILIYNHSISMLLCRCIYHYYNYFTIKVEFPFHRNTMAYLLLIEQ
jgi:hypothetical protein